MKFKMPYNTQTASSAQEDNRVENVAKPSPRKNAQPKSKKVKAGKKAKRALAASKSHFDGYCHMAFFEEKDRAAAASNLLAWPKASAIKKYVEENKISLSTERVSALLLLAPEDVDAVVAYHIVPGTLFPAEVLYSMADNVVVGGGVSGTSLAAYIVAYALMLCTYVCIAIARGATDDRESNERRLVTLGPKGFKPNKMPTKAERAGAAAAGIYKDAGGMAPVVQTLDNSATLWEAITNWKVNDRLAQSEAYGRVIIQPSATRLISMTGALMAKMGKFKFTDTFSQLKPTLDPVDVALCWGYNLDKLPTLRVGTAYTDKHSVNLWSYRPTSAQSRIKAVNTGIGYTSPRVSANQHIVGVTDNADKLVDAKDYIVLGDMRKKVPSEWYKAGNVKAQFGDNHIGMLVQWLIMLWSVRQAEEQGSTCHVRASSSAAEKYTLNVVPAKNTNETTEVKIMEAVAHAWEWAIRAKPFDLVLPGDSANPIDIIHMMFLCGMLQDTTKFRYNKTDLSIVPTYYTYQTDIREYLRIPLCNSLQTLSLVDLSENEYLMTSGGLECIIIDYVRRMGLQDQLHNAQLIACSLIVSDISNSDSNLMSGIPKPNHVQEYELWLSTRAQGRGTTLTLMQGESFALLFALLQIQRGVLIDVVAAKMIERVQSKGIPMISIAGEREAGIFLSEVLGSGASQLMSAWGSHMFGYVSAEQEKLLHTDAVMLTRYLEETFTTGRLRPTSCMLAGTTIETGAMSLIWDETTRVKEATSVFVTKPVARMLSMLYSERKNIFDTEGLFMFNFTDFGTKNRDQRMTISSTGLRRVGTIKGAPKMLYIGTVPAHNTMAQRLAHTGTGPQLAAHYEPFFDQDAAANNVQTDLPIKAGPSGNTKMHKDEPVSVSQIKRPAGQRTRKNSWVEFAKDALATAGRMVEGRSKDLQPVTPPRKDIYVEQMVYAQAPMYTRTMHPGSAYDAYHNGVFDTLKELASEASARAQAAIDTMSEPEENKASEIITANPARINKHVNQMYAVADFEEYEVVIAEEDQRGLYDHIKVVPTMGDGRCGVRALHTQMVAKGEMVSLAEVYEVEAQVCGLEERRVAKQIWATDEVLALVARQYGYSLVMYQESNDDDPTIDKVRVIATGHNRYLEILSQPTHWTAMEWDAEIDYADEETLRETVHAYLAGFGERAMPGAYSSEKGASGSEKDKVLFPAKTPKSQKPFRSTPLSAADDEIVAAIERNTPKSKQHSAADHYKWENKEHVAIVGHPHRTGLTEFQNGAIGVSRYGARTWDQYVEEVAAVHGGISNKISEYSTAELDGSAISPSTLHLGVELSLTTERMIRHLAQGADDHYYEDTLNKFCDHYMIKPEDRDHLKNSHPRVPVLKALAGFAELPFAVIEVDRSSEVMRLVRLHKYVPQHTAHSRYQPTFLLYGNNLFYLRMGEFSDPNAITRKEGLAAYLADVRTRYADSSYAAAQSTKSREEWFAAVDNKLAEMGIEPSAYKSVCSVAEMDMIFKKGTGEGEDQKDKLTSNLERLAGALLFGGYRREARWMLYNAKDWMKEQLGYFPDDPTWINLRVMAMLANAKGIKLWSINSSQRQITEWAANTAQNVIPATVYLARDGVTIYPCSMGTNAAKLTSISRFNAHCKRLKDEHGSIPEPPSELPTIPDARVKTALAVGSVAAIALGGIAVGAIIAVSVWTVYRKRVKAGSIGAAVNELVRGQNTATDAEFEQPLLAVEERSVWDDGWSLSSANHDEGEVMPDRLSQYTSMAVPLGGDPLGVTPAGPDNAAPVRSWTRAMLSKMN
uniref:Uncharacterized protein n=1 Tax=Sclerotinia sclerotiorum botybirnavirus 3 TaxID=2231703 RepID=A0A4Y6JK47_9VIRU|nr:hypothetical protein [Sclerotinia sclerotiorum botybirnavirus 3]